MVENTVADYDSFIALCRRFYEIKIDANFEKGIYHVLSEHKFNNPSEQLEEEIEKAKQILNGSELRMYAGNIDEFIGKPWKDIIFKAGKYAFFKGAIRFLFRNETGEWDWMGFDKKWDNAQKYFNQEGIYHKGTLLLRYFISKFTDGSLLEGMTFDNANNSWRNVLLNKKWGKPVHEMLVSDNTEVKVDYKSVLVNSDNIKKIIQEELVSTNLLDYTVEGCLLHNNVLYPSNAKADWKKYVIANKRNEILSSLYEGEVLDENKRERKIHTNQKIEKACDFFWGCDIKFEYVYKSVSYSFRWQSWDWIDMYEDNYRLVVKETAFTDKLVIDASQINTAEDLKRELERCINDYIEYKKHLIYNAIS